MNAYERIKKVLNLYQIQLSFPITLRNFVVYFFYANAQMYKIVADSAIGRYELFEYYPFSNYYQSLIKSSTLNSFLCSLDKILKERVEMSCA